MGRLDFTQDHRHDLLAAPNDRPHRNLRNFVRPCTPAHFLPHSMAAVLRLDDRLVEKIRQIIDVPVRTQDHVPATAAIAAIRPAFRHEFLPSKTGAPAPAFSGLCKNSYPIDEHESALVTSLKVDVVMISNLSLFNTSTH